MEQQILAGQTTLPNEDNYLQCWGCTLEWINHLMGTRLLPSSGDSNNNFSKTPLGTIGLRWWSVRARLWLGLFNWAYLCPPLPVLLSTSAYSSCQYPKDGWRWAECLLCLFPWHALSHVITTFLCLHQASLFGI
jgi:hypothetical protein